MPAPADRKRLPRLDLPGFQILPENRSAVRAVMGLARAVLLGKRPPVSPLVLHGPSGTGKTHLAAAVLGALVNEAEVVTARSVPAQELARPDDESGFADRDLPMCDFLVLEDLQHLPERAADAVCDLIDHRAARRKAMVVTAGTGPAGLTHLPRRLTSRLAAGLVVQLETLGAASRRAILEANAKTVRLSSDALDWLAAQGGGLRAALGLLQNLALVASSYPGPLDRAAVEQIVATTGQPTSRGTDLAAIMKRVCSAFGVTRRNCLAQPLRRAAPTARRNVSRARAGGAITAANRGRVRPGSHDRSARVPKGRRGDGRRRAAGRDRAAVEARDGLGCCQACGKPGARLARPIRRRTRTRIGSRHEIAVRNRAAQEIIDVPSARQVFHSP